MTSLDYYGVCVVVFSVVVVFILCHIFKMKRISGWILGLFVFFLCMYIPFSSIPVSSVSGDTSDGGASSAMVDVEATSSFDASFSDGSVDPEASSSGGASSGKVQNRENIVLVVLSKVQYALRSMTLGVNLSDIRNEVTDINKGYGPLYRCLLYLALLFAPFLTTTWLLSFFGGVYEALALRMRRVKIEHIFPEVDAPSLSLAKQISVEGCRLSSSGECVLFCEQTKREGDLADHQRWNITPGSFLECGHPICVKEKRYYFLSDNLEKNENRAMSLIANLNQQKVKNKSDITLFVRTDNELASKVIESSAKQEKQVKVCYLNLVRMQCYDLLKGDSELRPKESEKSVIIYGDHPIARELIKLYVWTSLNPIFYYTDQETLKVESKISKLIGSGQSVAEDRARIDKLFALNVKERVSLRNVLREYENREQEFILHLCPKSDHQATAYLNEVGKLVKGSKNVTVTCCFEEDICEKQAQSYFTSENSSVCIKHIKCYGAMSERFSTKMMENAIENIEEGKKTTKKGEQSSLSDHNKGMAVLYERDCLPVQPEEKGKLREPYESLYAIAEKM